MEEVWWVSAIKSFVIINLVLGVKGITRTDERRYALRVHREGYHSKTGIASELAWLTALRVLDFDGDRTALPKVLAAARRRQRVAVAIRVVREDRDRDRRVLIGDSAVGDRDRGSLGDADRFQLLGGGFDHRL